MHVENNSVKFVARQNLSAKEQLEQIDKKAILVLNRTRTSEAGGLKVI